MTIWTRRFFWLLAAYLVQRALFFSMNELSLSTVPAMTLLAAMVDGVRFDLCVIATINVPLLVIHLIVESGINSTAFVSFRKKIADAINLLFVASNLPLIIFGFADSKLYSFTGRRITLDTFAISGDIKSQSLGILLQYWPLTLAGFVFSACFIWQTWQRHSETFALDFPSRKTTVLRYWIFAILAFLAIRGGWQTKPLAPAHAYHWQPVQLSNFVLNSGFTFLRSPSSKAPKRFHDFEDMEALKKSLRRDLDGESTIPLAHGKNFIVIIVESLSTEYTGFANNGKGYTPFLDSLAKNSVVFRQSFANGRRSIDAMPAIFAGIPAWRNEPFITSPFASNKILTLPKILHDSGYRSLFFHGASNGSMHFDAFAKLAGFDEYIGRNEYPYKGDDDEQWGVYDEPFLKFALEKLSQTPQPFLGSIFTLTSHNPFKVPASESGKFPKGTLPIHESIGYVDKSLATFFKLASSEPWFHNTIFVITGDHTSLSERTDLNNLPGRFMVPILFFDPSGALPQIESSKIASHIDIPPTILELVGNPAHHEFVFGGPLFDRNWQGRFVQEEYETWYFRDRFVQLRIDSNDHTNFYELDDDDWKSPLNVKAEESAKDKESELRALRQYFTNGMIDNSWY
jgi:phosphoglycerol transferase MdoB-like AlkP superfamily enzyme